MRGTAKIKNRNRSDSSGRVALPQQAGGMPQSTHCMERQHTNTSLPDKPITLPGGGLSLGGPVCLCRLTPPTHTFPCSSFDFGCGMGILGLKKHAGRHFLQEKTSQAGGRRRKEGGGGKNSQKPAHCFICMHFAPPCSHFQEARTTLLPSLPSPN